MNDNELMTAVRESFADVHSATAVDWIVSRSRAVRARRRVPGVVAALGVAAAAAVAASVALTASHPASGHRVQLAAWTVTRQADGSICVTFREATHAAALQRTRAPTASRLASPSPGQQNPACQPYRPYALVIRPSALPSGTGLQIWTSGPPGAADNLQLYVSLVQASQQCTGS